jgi:hypothetical protein
MLVFDFDHTNYANLIKLITSNKKIFLLCYNNSKISVEPVNEWYLLQAYNKYIPSDDIVVAKMFVDPKINILHFFPRIASTGKEIPRAVFIDGLNSIEKYEGLHNAKSYIEWIKETLINLTNPIQNYNNKYTNNNHEYEYEYNYEYDNNYNNEDNYVIDISK